MENKSHDTAVIGGSNEVITFFKTYHYFDEKEQAQSDLNFVSDKKNGFTFWYITNLERWKLVGDYSEDNDEEFRFNLASPHSKTTT